MGLKEGDLVVYEPNYRRHGLDVKPVPAIIRSKPYRGKVEILCKQGTEFVKKRVVKLSFIRPAT